MPFFNMMLLLVMVTSSFSKPTPSNMTDVQVPYPSCSLPCGVGTCVELSSYAYPGSPPIPSCICTKPYIDMGSSKCSYKAKSKLVAFLISFFVGGWGVDWFYLSDGEAGYIVAGVFKIITFGGFGIWWLVDFIRSLADVFPDDNGMELFQDI